MPTDAANTVREHLRGELKVCPTVRLATLQEIQSLGDSRELRKQRVFLDHRKTLREKRMNILLWRYFAVGAAGFVGTIARFVVGSLFGRLNFRFPIGTLFINVTGSLFLGWFLTYIGSRNVSDTTRLAIAVGFCRWIHHLLHVHVRVQQTCPGRWRRFAGRSSTWSEVWSWESWGSPGNSGWRNGRMSLLGEQVLLRIYLQSADRAATYPRHERIVAAARKSKLAGATVIRGILGAGYHGIIRPSSWTLVEHVPIVVEIVDSADKIV